MTHATPRPPTPHAPARPARTVGAIVLLTAALLLAACGSSNKAPDAGGTPDGGTEGGSTETAEGALTITDVNGTVTLDAPAVKVVALEWTYVEDLLALGVQPVGVADVENYRAYVAQPELPADTEDVGTRQEPSLERIRRLDPDLIIAADTRTSENLEQLGDIATVISFNPYPEDTTVSQYEEMLTTFGEIAKAVGKVDEGAAVLADLDARIAEAKATFADADLDTDRVVLAQGEGTPEAPMFRLFTDNAMVVELAERLGLQNGWDGADEASGFNSVSLEGLTAVTDAWFLPVAPSSATSAFDDAFGDSPLWQSLEIVQDDRIRLLDPATWYFGGPVSAGYLIGQLETALLG